MVQGYRLRTIIIEKSPHLYLVNTLVIMSTTTGYLYLPCILKNIRWNGLEEV